MGSSQTGRPGSASQPAPPDHEQINLILAETKQVLNGTVAQTAEKLAMANIHPDANRRPSSAEEASMLSSSDLTMPSNGDVARSHETPQQNMAASGNSGFLLNPNRRHASNGGMHPFQRNSSVFVREVPNEIDERVLREVCPFLIFLLLNFLFRLDL